jgi:hypothetical protein
MPPEKGFEGDATKESPMNRCLHITIHENGKTVPESSGSTTGLPIPETTDPGTNYVEPPPDGKVIYPVTSPSAEGFGASLHGSAAYGATVETGCACACCAPPACAASAGAGSSAATSSGVPSRDYSGFVIVRLAEGVVGDIPAENLWTLGAAHQPRLAGLQAVLELPITTAPTARTTEPQPAPSPAGRQVADPAVPPAVPPALPEPPAGALVSRPLVELKGQMQVEKEKKVVRPVPRSQCLTLLREMEKQAATTAFRPLHSLTAYWRVDLRDRPDLTGEVVERLNRLAEVDLAYRELSANDPQLNGGATGKALEEDQGYLDDAPTGISAAWAWQMLTAPGSRMASTFQTGLQVAKVTVCDLEQGWNPHSELQAWVGSTNFVDPFVGGNRAKEGSSSGDHGTAVLGQLAATGTSPIGAKGGPDLFQGTSGHVAAAIVQALPKPQSQTQLQPLGPLSHGDVLLLEVQRGLLPTEVDDADFDAIRLASALQVIVVEAGGNGGFDLDSYAGSDGERILRLGDSGFRDSGAILVGAARAAVPHDRAPFSNYGSRIDCFGWGEAVTTTGFGDLAGLGTADLYTNRFNGTSSASPIIAGAAALVQALHQKQTGGQRLEPREMRSILGDPATGTRQGPNVAGNIGIMPDLRAIVRDRLQLVPDVYLRRSIGDDGSAPDLTDEISSSPDILVWNGPGDPNQTFGEASTKVNLPAPGDISTAAGPLYLRLRNRGLGLGAVQAQLFASPVATLITPERWIPVGTLDTGTMSPIPQGDTLVVAGPLAWTPPQLTTQGWSFLSILTPPGNGSVPLGAPFVQWGLGLPPGPPYFDWDVYRAFLRRPGVAWRNTYRVNPTAGGATNATVTFRIAGTPDQARRFDFEIIQRLPTGTSVTLDLANAPALAAKLRQNQSWLGGTGTSLTLPMRPRTTLRRLELAAGTSAEASFTVTPGSALTAAHSLALRQLWKGEEVGRITWYFGPA